MKKDTLPIISVVISLCVSLSACSPNISGLQEGRANCLAYGYKPGSENYTKCMFLEDERRVEKRIKEQKHNNKPVKLR